ncbi:NAD(P)/FAD-dependent oxidoreductase [Limnofasciculus baicalensis]|uniref:FAD-binding oxidoreductase n=1 Tax=Limnofasciculus baicalensis BBK-W-15 TaxID=2699891 RepID=A0AAE3KMY1_9CYAN|nr:FAD-dependent oxidoreductase [Limnofasciculus baicalensis]MCP2729960.1 FAD-binding oxidoreductase [Limnofasciculus baicalensis BBK-W-15]
MLVGAGIVNLITAYYLTEAGYSITIYDASPDPRESQHWSRYGCTRGGGDARMFTLTEADNYNDKDFTGIAHFNNLFGSKVSESGWVICDINNISIPEQTWIHEYEAVPPWLANVYNDDILSFNHESHPLWEDLIENASELFQGVELREGIVRLYSDEAHYRQSIERHRKIQSLRRAFMPEELTEIYPALADACANGVVAGAMEVVGFTLNVHKFIAKLLARLEKVGVQCFWNQSITKIIRNHHGVVIGLESSNHTITADNYVISPGVYGSGFLRGTQTENKIQGVLGGWMLIPNLAPKLEHSLKIARKGHITEDANVTVATDSKGEEILIFGSGYGYTGLDPSNILPDDLEAMYCGIEDSIKRYFPAAYEAAKQSGLLEASRRYCVRPWTSTSLGVFEAIESTSDGKLIVTGGHNTGGFTQSPAIAKAVLAALRGELHPMHHLYHPNRFASFYSQVPRRQIIETPVAQ